jgi:hypothetical protein
MKKKQRRLFLEVLEDRLTPSTSHPLWPDAAHLTLSFVPDGTLVSGTPSNLFATLNAAAPTANWETAILQAFEAWAGSSNINIGLVSDGGQPLGTSGAVQGDSRFGDIRIAARPLPLGTVATTNFFSWTGSTWHGNMILNSNYNFGINGSGQYDLFTVALHEAGHVFGFDDETTDPQSVMYANYTGPRTGLAAEDIANLQAEYGTRLPDAFDSVQPNTSFSSAAVLQDTGATINMAADLSTSTDVDYFKFQTPNNILLTGFAFGVRTNGMSLLVPSLTIYNANFQVVASASASSVLNGNLSLKLSAGRNSVFYVRIGRADNNFGIGGYQFFLTNYLGNYLPPVPALLPAHTYVDNLDANNSIRTAIDLTSAPNNMTQIPENFVYWETFNLSTDHDFFKVRVASASGANTLSVIAWGSALLSVTPIIHVYDTHGNPLALQVLTNNGGTYAVQVANTTPGSNYYVEVDPQQGGLLSGYTVYANFSSVPQIALATVGSNTLSQTNSQDSATLTITQNQLFHFVLAASSADTNTYVTMQVLDQNGNVILSLSSYAGQPPATAMTYLQAGTYTLIYTAHTSSGGSIDPVTYWLLGEDLSEPQAAYYTSGSPGTGSGSSSNTYAYSGPSSGSSKPVYY